MLKINEMLINYKNKGFFVIKDFFSNVELLKVENSLKNTIYKISNNKNFKNIENLNSKKFQKNFDKFSLSDPLKAGAIYDSMQTSIALKSLATSKKVIKILCKILEIENEASVSNFFSSIRLDLPQKKKNLLSWHQDFMDTSKKNLDYSRGITIWAPLNKVDKNNGSMMVCVGSHKKRVNIISKKRVSINSSEYLMINNNEIKKYRKKLITCKRGDVVFMNMNCIHKSVIGKSNLLRKTIISRYVDINSNSFVPGALKFTPSFLK